MVKEFRSAWDVKWFAERSSAQAKSFLWNTESRSRCASSTAGQDSLLPICIWSWSRVTANVTWVDLFGWRSPSPTLPARSVSQKVL